MKIWSAALPLLVAASLAGCSAQSLPSTPDGVEVLTDIPYCTGTVGNSREILFLDIARPKGQSEALPVSLFVHGGGWGAGSKEDYRFALLALAQQNRVAVSVNYRLAPKSQFPAQLEDVKCAVRWIRAHAEIYRFDTRRLVAVGGSAGAHLVAMLGTTAGHAEFEGNGGFGNQSSSIDAMVLHGGPYDLRTVVREVKAAPTEHTPAALNSLSQFLGGPLEDREELYRTASPTTYVSQSTVPALLIHGRKDPIIPYTEAVRFSQAIRAAGVNAQTLVIDDAGHGDFGKHPDEPGRQFINFIRGPDATRRSTP